MHQLIEQTYNCVYEGHWEKVFDWNDIDVVTNPNANGGTHTVVGREQKKWNIFPFVRFFKMLLNHESFRLVGKHVKFLITSI